MTSRTACSEVKGKESSSALLDECECDLLVEEEVDFCDRLDIADLTDGDGGRIPVLFPLEVLLGEDVTAVELGYFCFILSFLVRRSFFFGGCDGGRWLFGCCCCW